MDAQPHASFLKNPDRFRQTVAVLALLAWPVLSFLGFLTSPPGTEHTPAVFRAEETKVQLSALFFLWSAMSMIPAALGLAHLLRRRATAWGNLGAALALFGSASSLPLFMTDFYDLAIAQRLPDAQGEALIAHAGELPGFVFGILLPAFLVHAGALVLMAGLAVAGIASWWVPAVAGAGIVFPFLVIEQSPFVQAAGPLVQLAAYGVLALKIWRMPAAEWAGTTARPLVPA